MRTSSIRLRANARLAILHEDFLEICDGNMLAAMLLSILVYWTDVKIAKKDENLWIWKSHEDFQEDLMFDKPGMKPPHRTTIKAALDLLVSKKFLQWRRNPKMPLDQTRQYLAERKAIQTAIDALPPIVVKPTMESQNTDNALSEEQQSLSENQQCNDGIPTSNTNDYSTEITDPEITEQRERDVADATARSQPSSQNDLSEETVKREAVKASQKEVTHDTSRDYPVDSGLRNNGTRAHSYGDNPALAQQKEKDTNKITQPPAPRKPPANPTIPKRPRPQQQELKDTKPVESELSSEATAIMDKWDSVNKRPVPRTASVIEGATLLIPCNPTAEELDTCKKWLFTTDDPKKPWFRKIGVGLLDVAKNFSKWQSLQEMQPVKPPGKEESNEHKSNFYTLDAFIERQNQWKTETEGVTS